MEEQTERNPDLETEDRPLTEDAPDVEGHKRSRLIEDAADDDDEPDVEGHKRSR